MRPDVRGFSLLEAIVALAILAAAGLALFTALTQSLQMLGRAERARELDRAMRNALLVVERVEPSRQARGEADVGGYLLRWTLEPIEPPKPGATGFLQSGYYEVGLYRVRIQLWRDGVLEHAAEVRRAGYRQVRRPAAI